ncbi:hypothetical protein [Flavobacterium rivuli]|uniref:hypothetical protein n=1 Tax=Flavobacterium rivuli TaxID=498301 RepID=UPI0003615918|nr:hypothetical protein [Flavobacterium rivuli]
MNVAKAVRVVAIITLVKHWIKNDIAKKYTSGVIIPLIYVFLAYYNSLTINDTGRNFNR